jgi:hypothetical protein
MDTFCSGTGILKKERDQNQKRKAKISRRPGLSSSSPPGFIKNLHPRASGSIFNKKPDIPSRLPYGLGFLFSVFFWGNACWMYFIGWLKLWIRQQMGKRGAMAILRAGREVSRFPAKSFLPLENQLKEKSFCQEPGGPDLDCARAEAIFD